MLETNDLVAARSTLSLAVKNQSLPWKPFEFAPLDFLKTGQLQVTPVSPLTKKTVKPLHPSLLVIGLEVTEILH